MAVWFSCGAASAVAAMLAIQKFGRENVMVLNNFILEEHPDNRRFLHDVENWLRVKIVDVRNSHYPDGSCESVWRSRWYMSGIAGASCTFQLKKRARQQWEDTHHHDALVMGFCAEEKNRHDRFVKQERDNLLPLLIEEGIDKSGCASLLQSKGIRLPEMYLLGFPNANCIGCVKATSPTYWNHTRRHFPDVFAQRARTSRDLGCRLVRHKGERIFLDELPDDATGRPLKSLDLSCSVFCS